MYNFDLKKNQTFLQTDSKTEMYECTLKDDGGVRCLHKDPTIGQFDISCDLTEARDNTTIDHLATTSGKGVTIVNSQIIIPLSIDSQTTDNKTYQVMSCP